MIAQGLEWAGRPERRLPRNLEPFLRAETRTANVRHGTPFDQQQNHLA